MILYTIGLVSRDVILCNKIRYDIIWDIMTDNFSLIIFDIHPY